MHPSQTALLVVAVAWITNLYNFMDGSDGLAGGMALDRLRRLCGSRPGSRATGRCSRPVRCIAAAARGLPVFNFHPARIFLGDVGSIPLGFLAAALGILGWRDDAWPLWFPLLVFAPFIADATVTLAQARAARARASGRRTASTTTSAWCAWARPSRHRADRLRGDAGVRGAASGRGRRRAAGAAFARARLLA